MAPQFNPQPFNSVSYVDVVALQLGLQRLPAESADTFLDRLYQAANNVRDHTYQGTIDQIAFELGLSVRVGMTITCFDPTVLVVVSFGQVSITQGTSPVTIPLVTIDADNYWSWRQLSDVVSDINTKTPCTATLSGSDGLAWQLVNQSSLNIVIAEPVTNKISTLTKTGIIVGTERFNVGIPKYTLTSSGDLAFQSTPPANTQVTYVYNLSPFDLAISQVGAFSLMDPSLAAYAAGSDGSLVHQLREYTQDLLTQDPSYWAV